MSWPTKTLAALAGRMEDLPVRFYSDPSDSNPFARIVDASGKALAFGINLSALVGGTGLMDSSHESGIDVGDPGRMAVGRVDFSATGTAGCIVTVGAVTYTEADTAVAASGVWTNGASAADSATSLAAAINGDERNSGGNSYAAVVSSGTVFILALAVGTAGNVTVTSSEAQPDAVENLVGGAAAAVKQIVTLLHTVTTEEADAVEVIIPLPFDATYFSWQVYDSSGGIYATEITDRGTVTAASSPVTAYFKLATNGATHISAGDIVRLVAQE